VTYKQSAVGWIKRQ